MVNRKILTVTCLTAFLLINCEKANGSKKLLCADFKTGEYQLVNNDSRKKFLLERTSHLQIEQTYDLTTGDRIKKDRYYKISWKNDCEYNLILDTTRSQYDEIDLYINSKGGYKCLIKKIDNNCSTVETSVEGEDSQISKICKIQ
jgi:hypothetical protein